MGRVRAGFVAFAKNFSALIEVILGPGAGGKVGNVIELVPQTIQLLLSVVIEDELDQREIVAVIAHDVVIAGAQQAAFVLRVVGEITAAFGDVKRVGKHRSEAGKCGLVAGALGGGNDQIGIVGAGLGGESGPTGRGFLVKIGVFRDLRNHGRRIGVVTQIFGIAVTPVLGILLQLPVQKRLGLRGQTRHDRRGKLHRGVGADFHHEITHFRAFCAEHAGLSRRREGAGPATFSAA